MPRPDQSMSLLNDLQEHALEPEYAEVAATGERRGSSWVMMATVALLAALIVVALVSTVRSSDDLETERAELLERIQQQRGELDGLEAEVAAVEQEISELTGSQVADPELQAELDRLGGLTGAVPVTGPGIVVTVDDARRTDSEGVVFDSDLSRLVNGLRQAGAEAIAINGRRITSLTPIRTAGSAITVDYVSLSPPYRIEAIGDPGTLPGRFGRTAAAAWWQYLGDNYGIQFSMTEADGDLTLPADPGMTVRFASDD